VQLQPHALLTLAFISDVYGRQLRVEQHAIQGFRLSTQQREAY
jgi:hypothetical protein